MFSGVIGILTALTIGLAGLAVVAGGLAFTILGLMNMWSILDPRMGAQIKSGLLKVAITVAIMGAGTGMTALATAIASAAGTPAGG